MLLARRRRSRGFIHIYDIKFSWRSIFFQQHKSCGKKEDIIIILRAKVLMVSLFAAQINTGNDRLAAFIY